MLIYGEKIYTPLGFTSGYIKTEGSTIVKISGIADEKPDRTAHYVLPGFIDIHTHGAYGEDTQSSAPEGLVRIKEYMSRCGITSYLPTTVSDTIDNLINSIHNVRCAAQIKSGANIIGMHIEGPYFTFKYKGAHIAEYLKAPDKNELDRMIDAGDGLLRMICLAPEYENSSEFIKYAVSRGITVSVAHTDATYEEVKAAYAAGASNTTHLYNAMSPLAHRAPGTVGAALDSDVPAELICDGLHVHSAAARIAIEKKGADNIALISDSLSCAGLPDGNYTVGPQPVIVKNGEARIPEGNLAGSTTNVYQCFRNVINWGISISDAVKMASETPAKIVKADKKGKIAVGCDADFTLLNEDLSLAGTIICGK